MTGGFFDPEVLRKANEQIEAELRERDAGLERAGLLKSPRPRPRERVKAEKPKRPPRPLSDGEREELMALARDRWPIWADQHPDLALAAMRRMPAKKRREIEALRRWCAEQREKEPAS